MSEQLKYNYSVRSDVQEHQAADFGFLRAKAIEYTQEASGTLWTDYNVHDPGVTFLEAICYAMTEVAHRMSLDLEQLLLHSSSGRKVYQNQLLVHANELIPPKASTLEDYSILLLDQLVNELTHVFVTAEAQDMNGVKGLYTISAIPRNDLSTLEQEQLVQKIYSLFIRHRNIGEDLKEVRILNPRLLAVECAIELSNDIDAHECIARFFFALNQLLNPTVKYNSYNQLIENGLSVDDIFDNPSFTNGFIDRFTLSKKQKTLQLNRIKQLLARQKGVRAISDFYVLIDGILQREEWYSIDEYDFITVELSFDKVDYFTKIHVKQANELIEIDFSRVFHIYSTLVQEEYAKNLHRFVAPSYPLQSTISKKDLLQYKSIVYDLPSIYRVGIYEPASNEDSSIQSSSKQLTDYLSFFDQILENYLSQLTQLEHLFSIEEQDTAESYEQHISTTQLQVYQHLLARLGEFAYSNVQSSSTQINVELLKDKLGRIIRFIQKNGRFELAGQYYVKEPSVIDVEDFPIKAKLAYINDLAITGIAPLTQVFEDISKVHVEEVVDTSTKASEDIIESSDDEAQQNAENQQVSSEAQGFVFDSPTKDFWKYLLSNVNDPKKFFIRKRANNHLLFFKKDDHTEAQLISESSNKNVLQNQLNEFLNQLEEVNNRSEGFHIVEHILLRPRITTKVYFSLTKDKTTLFKSSTQDLYEPQLSLAKDSALLAAYKNNYKVVDLKNEEFGVAIKDLSGTIVAESLERFITKVGAEDFISESVTYFEKLKNEQKLADVILISSPKDYHLSILDKVGDTLFKTKDAQSLDVLHDIQEKVLALLKISENYTLISKNSSSYYVQIEINDVVFNSKQAFESEEKAKLFIDKSLKVYRGIRIIPDTSIFFKTTSIYARNADIYNYRATLLYPEWPTKFQNEQFVRNFIHTAKQEFPSYMNLEVKPLNLAKMQAFEEIYFPWLQLLAELDDNANEQINLMSSKLLDILTA